MTALEGIFASSLNTGEVMENWRLSNVVSLFKKGREDKTRELWAGEPNVSSGKVVGVDRNYQHLDKYGLISNSAWPCVCVKSHKSNTVL